MTGTVVEVVDLVDEDVWLQEKRPICCEAQSHRQCCAPRIGRELTTKIEGADEGGKDGALEAISDGVIDGLDDGALEAQVPACP